MVPIVCSHDRGGLGEKRDSVLDPGIPRKLELFTFIDYNIVPQTECQTKCAFLSQLFKSWKTFNTVELSGEQNFIIN